MPTACAATVLSDLKKRKYSEMNMFEYLKDITDLAPFVGTKPFCGLRFNPIKLEKRVFERIAPCELTPCTFYSCGYRIHDDSCGTYPLHMAGGYYIQEPSAMSAITALQVEPFDTVLDMCAAPGSKSTAIAAHCDVLVSNEINPKRVMSLISNIERMGVSNAIVTNSDSRVIAQNFEGYFDKVLVDSPCSGEGMFRRHPQIIENWSAELVEMCARRSSNILKNAARTVKQGGRLVYSTCTYNLEENEMVILDFLRNNPDFELTDTGIPDCEKGFLGLDKASRIFIKNGGEGHFVCAMQRTGAHPCKSKVQYFKVSDKTDFLSEVLCAPLKFYKNHDFGIIEHQGVKYAVHKKLPLPQGVRIMRAGVRLGCYTSKTFKPDHHLFMAARPSSFETLETDEKSACAFLNGQPLNVSSQLKGYVAVTYNGLAMGFGKASGAVLKNHYPHGLRTL